MCLVAVAHDVHPSLALVIAANRDEFLARPALPLAPWSDDPEVVGGRDLEKGGSWLALRRSGRLALVTNHRDFRRRAKSSAVPAPSRGDLVAGFVRGSEAPADFAARITAADALYEPYNVLFGDARAGGALHWHSNVTGETRALERGQVHGLSNALLDTPWPKVERLRETLARALASSTETIRVQSALSAMEATMLEALANRDVAPVALLPDTGAGPELELALSAAFVRLPEYGTRCSTVLSVDREGLARFVERTFDAAGAEVGTRIEHVRLAA